MIILGIETSCDETGIAIVEDGTNILSNITATSAGIHAKTGGIIPEDAARKQVTSILPVLNLALEESGLLLSNIDAIAVTYGPGLIGSLLVGVETAKTLSMVHHIPLIPVNHLVAHMYANFIDSGVLPEFPAISLTVSGGHTDLVLIKDHGHIEKIGSTRDDAAGEAFDKTARLLGIEYPGGPKLAALADKFIAENKDEKLNMFPRPMINDDNFDWSFSGLKTSVLYKINELVGDNNKLSDYKTISTKENVKNMIPQLAAEVQEAIVDSLVTKTVKAIEKHQPKSMLLGGGVAANQRLRHKLDLRFKIQDLRTKLYLPNPKYCTDNGAVIASAAFFNNKKFAWNKIDVNPELTITSNTET